MMTILALRWFCLNVHFISLFFLMFTLYRKKLSHNLLTLKQLLLILAAVIQDYNTAKSGFNLKLDLLPSYSFK